MYGTAFLISSGVDSLCALYSSNASCLKVGPAGSNATPKWVGFSLLRMSSMVFTKPKMAEVLSPCELILGFFIKAKYALYINA